MKNVSGDSERRLNGLNKLRRSDPQALVLQIEAGRQPDADLEVIGCSDGVGRHPFRTGFA